MYSDRLKGHLLCVEERLKLRLRIQSPRPLTLASRMARQRMLLMLSRRTFVNVFFSFHKQTLTSTHLITPNAIWRIFSRVVILDAPIPMKNYDNPKYLNNCKYVRTISRHLDMAKKKKSFDFINT